MPSRIMTVVSITGPGHLKGKTLLTNTLAALLEKFTKTKSLIIRLHSGQRVPETPPASPAKKFPGGRNP
jgi:hypothetical protein